MDTDELWKHAYHYENLYSHTQNSIYFQAVLLKKAKENNMLQTGKFWGEGLDKYLNVSNG